MAKKATASSGTAKSAGRGKARSGTSVARISSSGNSGGRSGSREKFDPSEALIKLLQSPLMAELVAVAATAALAALAENGFSTGSSRGKRAGNAVKAAGKAAAAAVGRRLSTEMDEIRSAATAKRGAAA